MYNNVNILMKKRYFKFKMKVKMTLLKCFHIVSFSVPARSLIVTVMFRRIFLETTASRLCWSISSRISYKTVSVFCLDCVTSSRIPSAYILLVSSEAWYPENVVPYLVVPSVYIIKSGFSGICSHNCCCDRTNLLTQQFSGTYVQLV